MVDLNALLRRPVEYYETPWTLETALIEFSSRSRARMQAADVGYVFCKSMPRSGHRLLANCLMLYFRGRLHYCEYYSPFGCCRTIPCTKPHNEARSNRFFLQKSHDFGFRDAKGLNGKYMIQYRSPIPRLQSNFDLYARDTGENSVESFRAFAERETIYFINFYRKWIATPTPDSFVLPYEALIEDQRSALSSVIGFIEVDRPLDQGALDGVIEQIPIGPNALPESPQALRDPRAHRFFDEQFFAGLERQIRDACGADHIRFHFL